MSMADRDGWIWYDGKMVPWRDATTHVLTHTLHYGMGVFEGVRCYAADKGPAIFRLRDHTDRLFRSARIFGMKIPFTPDVLIDAQRACVRQNELAACYIRPIAFYGSVAMGVAARSNPVLVARFRQQTLGKVEPLLRLCQLLLQALHGVFECLQPGSGIG